ncbi:hypothetical protein ACUX4G_24805, partial [Salmonella enterica]
TVLFIIVVAFAAFATGNVDRFAEGNATNEAFLTIAGNVGGIWLKVAFSIIVAFVCAVGNIITAQTAVSIRPDLPPAPYGGRRSGTSALYSDRLGPGLRLCTGR